MKKRFLCFALAAMLIGGSVVTAMPVYAEGTTITATKDADAPYTGREYTAPAEKTAVSDIMLPDGWSWLNTNQSLTTEFADAVVIQKADGIETNRVTVKVKREADTEAPTGTIAIDTNIWKTFLNTITFNTLFRTTKTVTITAQDNLAVASVQYYVSEAALTLEQVTALDEAAWKKYPENGFELAPTGRYVVYALITDTSDNTAYISSDGLVFRLESGQKSNADVADNIINTTEDKNTGTDTTKVATTTAIVKTETKTAINGTKTTTATVDTNTAAKIVEKAVENKSEEVVVNTGAGVTETAAGSTTEIQLPEQTVQGLSQKTEASVTIKSESAEVTLNKEAVDGLASQAGDDGYVRLVVETVKQDESAVQVDLKLITSKGNVTDFRGGSVSVTVKLNASLAAKPVVCVYIDDFKTYHKVKGAKKADGTYTFETGHFSSYAVMAEEEADKVIAEQTANIKKLAGDLSLKARSAKTAKGNIKATLTVNEDAIKEIEALGYTVKYKFYRSTKKSAGYKAVIEKTGKTYTNTTGKKGTRYYYKARVMIYDAQGELVTKTALTQCKYACRIWSK